MKQLNGIDAAFVYLDSSNAPMHIGGMMLYDPSTAPDGRVGVDQIRRLVRGRLADAPSLRRRLVKVPLDLDLPYWADAQVDLNHHIRHESLPTPGTWHQLSQRVARFLEKPLDMSRPPWELQVIDGLGSIEGLPDGAFAVALKVHHSAIDGVAGLQMVAALHDGEAAPAETGRTDRLWTVENPSWLDLVLKSALPTVTADSATVTLGVPHALRRPTRLLGNVIGLGSGYLRRLIQPAPATDEASAAEPVPETRFNGPVSSARSTGGVQFALAEVKEIKNAVPGVTVNDVVMTVVGGALRSYLREQGELPEQSLVAGIAMSVRSDDERDEGGNRLNFRAVRLGTDLADPMQRLRSVHGSATRAKSVLNDGGARQLLDVADSIPAGVMGLGGRLATQFQLTAKVRMINTPVTNVPGPSVPLYLAGAKMVTLYGYALAGPGMGLVHCISSYCGNVTIGFQVAAELLPDTGSYEDCLRESFDDLYKAALTPAGQDRTRST